MAATPIGKASVNDVLITRIAKSFFEVLRGSLVLTKCGIVDYSADFKEAGESVKVASIGDFTAANADPDSAVAIQNSTLTAGTITLDKYVPVDFIIKDIAEAVSGMNLIENYSRSAAGAIIQSIEETIGDIFDDTYFAAVGTATFSDSAVAVVGVGTKFTKYNVGAMVKTAGGATGRIATITDDTHMTMAANMAADEAGVAFSVSREVTFASNASFDDTVIRKARKVLVDAKVAESGRVLLCNTDDYDDLLGDTKYTAADSMNMGMLVNGALGRIRGFSVFESNNFDKSHSVAFTPAALGIAFRPFKPVNDGGVVSKIITDPVTGIPLRVMMSYDAANRGYRISLDILYGVKLFKPEWTCRIYQTA